MTKRELYKKILRHFCGEDCMENGEVSTTLEYWIAEFEDSIVNAETERCANRIEAREKFHRKRFKEFHEKTNGNVMNGHLIKAETCKEILLLIKK